MPLCTFIDITCDGVYCGGGVWICCRMALKKPLDGHTIFIAALTTAEPFLANANLSNKVVGICVAKQSRVADGLVRVLQQRLEQNRVMRCEPLH